MFYSIGFHVIGTGVPHAINALVSRGCNQETTLEEAILMVYEAKKMAERAPGVGSNITDMCLLTIENIYQFSRDMIDDKIGSIYEKWRFGSDQTWKEDMTSFLKETFRSDEVDI